MPGSVWNSRWSAWPGLCAASRRSSWACASARCSDGKRLGAMLGIDYSPTRALGGRRTDGSWPARLLPQTRALGIIQDVRRDFRGAASPEYLDLEPCPHAHQIEGQVDEADMLRHRVAPAAAPEPPLDLPARVHRLAAVQVRVIRERRGERDGAELSLTAVRLDAAQGLAPDEFTLSEPDAEAEAGLVRTLRRREVGAPVAITFLEPE